MVNTLKQFFNEASVKKSDLKRLPDDLRAEFNWVERAFKSIGKPTKTYPKMACMNFTLE